MLMVLDDCLSVRIEIIQHHRRAVSRSELPGLGGEEGARRAAHHIEAARSDNGLIEVIDVVAHGAVGRDVGAEVLEVQIPADERARPWLARPELLPRSRKQKRRPAKELERSFIQALVLATQPRGLPSRVELADRFSEFVYLAHDVLSLLPDSR